MTICSPALSQVLKRSKTELQCRPVKVQGPSVDEPIQQTISSKMPGSSTMKERTLLQSAQSARLFSGCADSMRVSMDECAFVAFCGAHESAFLRLCNSTETRLRVRSFANMRYAPSRQETSP